MISKEVTSRRKRCATETDDARNVDELLGGSKRMTTFWCNGDTCFMIAQTWTAPGPSPMSIFACRVRVNDEQWTMTPETHKYATAAASFCFVAPENGDRQDIRNLTTKPCVQRSSYLNQMINNFSN